MSSLSSLFEAYLPTTYGVLTLWPNESIETFPGSWSGYAGPIKVRLSKYRGPGTLKGYIAVFVCFATHAIHIEIVEDYSEESFVAAFHRVNARRGYCTDHYLDQGTTFVGADSELKALFETIQNQSTKIYNDLWASNTNWHINPPGAPHFGGLWEAAVKSAKYHLVRVIGEKVSTFVELSTVLCRIEAILNSRPLMALTDDVNDLVVLTPAHFLINRPSFLVSEPDLTLDKKEMAIIQTNGAALLGPMD